MSHGSFVVPVQQEGRVISSPQIVRRQARCVVITPTKGPLVALPFTHRLSPVFAVGPHSGRLYPKCPWLSPNLPAGRGQPLLRGAVSAVNWLKMLGKKPCKDPVFAGPAVSSKQIAPPRALCFILVSLTLARALSGVNDRQYTICIVFVHSSRLRRVAASGAFQA
jgi:hypothetical protein